jgi:hypothetical protein
MEWLMYMLLGSILFTSGTYLVYWLIVEMPVLIKIKHEELYERWRDR